MLGTSPENVIEIRQVVPEIWLAKFKSWAGARLFEQARLFGTIQYYYVIS